VFANVLLGANQGLAWSMTVVMKIDLVGPARRGLAMGLNEFAGYVAVALAAFVAGVMASRYGLRSPFYLGIAFAVLGLLLSWAFVQETQGHARWEAARRGSEGSVEGEPAGAGERALSGREVFLWASWKHPALFSCNQAGLVNNLNDGLA